MALRANAKCETRPDVLAAPAGRPPARRYLALLAMPAAAIAVYAALHALDLRLPTGPPLLIVTAGFVSTALPNGLGRRAAPTRTRMVRRLGVVSQANK